MQCDWLERSRTSSKGAEGLVIRKYSREMHRRKFVETINTFQALLRNGSTPLWDIKTSEKILGISRNHINGSCSGY